MSSNQPLIHAYRNLYRQGLRVVNYSAPSRHVVRHTLQTSFRSSPPEDYDPQKITKTLEFLRRAAESAGMEHRIVKNLLMVRFWDQPGNKKELRKLKGVGVDRRDPFLRKEAIAQFDSTLAQLNESLGTCLR